MVISKYFISKQVKRITELSQYKITTENRNYFIFLAHDMYYLEIQELKKTDFCLSFLPLKNASNFYQIFGIRKLDA